MNKFKCPHCRQKLGNYLYAAICPFCRKELEHNRRPTRLSDDAPSHPGVWMFVIAGVGMICVLLHAVGVPVPGLGERSGLGGYALRFLGAGLIGAGIGRIGGTVWGWHAQAEKIRWTAFLAGFDLPVGRLPRNTPLPANSFVPQPIVKR